MKFNPLYDVANTIDTIQFETDYKGARQIGSLCFGERYLYVKKLLSASYISYTSISRYFRRVENVDMKMCCGKGSLDMERVVVCIGDREVIEEKMPDTRAAVAAIEELAKRAPQALNKA